MVAVNVTGGCLGAMAGHEYLRRSGWGVLLNLCSASALFGQPTLPTYAATKAAVKALSGACRSGGRTEPSAARLACSPRPRGVTAGWADRLVVRRIGS